jgi:hypothetical protein
MMWPSVKKASPRGRFVADLVSVERGRQVRARGCRRQVGAHFGEIPKLARDEALGDIESFATAEPQHGQTAPTCRRACGRTLLPR